MPKLAHLNEGLNSIQKRLAQVDKSDDIRRDDLDKLLNGRFDKISDRLQGSLNRLMEESDKAQSVSLSKAVEGVVKAVADTHGIFKEGLAQISEEARLSHDILTTEIGGINNDAGNQLIVRQIGDIKTDLNKLPKSFPVPKDVDLSDITYALKSIRIPDVSPELAKLRKLVTRKRGFVFNVERGVDDLINKIVVNEK